MESSANVVVVAQNSSTIFYAYGPEWANLSANSTAARAKGVQLGSVGKPIVAFRMSNFTIDAIAASNAVPGNYPVEFYAINFTTGITATGNVIIQVIKGNGSHFTVSASSPEKVSSPNSFLTYLHDLFGV